MSQHLVSQTERISRLSSSRPWDDRGRRRNGTPYGDHATQGFADAQKQFAKRINFWFFGTFSNRFSRKITTSFQLAPDLLSSVYRSKIADSTNCRIAKKMMIFPQSSFHGVLVAVGPTYPSLCSSKLTGTRNPSLAIKTPLNGEI